jgi:hypothetical protein
MRTGAVEDRRSRAGVEAAGHVGEDVDDDLAADAVRLDDAPDQTVSIACRLHGPSR